MFTEADVNDWSSVEKGDAYGVAKTEAEKLVHAHFASHSDRSSVAVNPGVVIGPVMTKAHTKASALFLRDLIYGNKVMNFPCTFVDVRDVAAGHVNALEKVSCEERNGKQCHMVNFFIWTSETLPATSVFAGALVQLSLLITLRRFAP